MIRFLVCVLGMVVLECSIIGSSRATAAEDDGSVARPPFDMRYVRDPSTLELRTISDWQDVPGDPPTRQKVVEITVCHWWPGQRVRVPVAMIVPAGPRPCRYLLVEAMGVTGRRAALSEWMKPLVARGVGVVMAGVGTIEGTPPAGALNVGMNQRLMETKDVRYTAPWLWGISYMRAVTVALAEKDVFRPVTIAATGGSKRGVAAACAAIHDDRFTAFMPIVAPAFQPSIGLTPGARQSADVQRANARFFERVKSGRFSLSEQSIADVVAVENERLERFSIDEFRNAGWTDDDFQRVARQIGDMFLTTRHLDALAARGVEFCHQLGSNDNVSPDLVELGREYPQFPLFILPGGQHGGPWEALTRKTPTSPEIYANQSAFFTHHFLGGLERPPMPKVSWRRSRDEIAIEVTFEDFPAAAHVRQGSLYWSFDREPAGSMPYLFTAWESLAMKQDSSQTWTCALPIAAQATTLDFLGNFIYERESAPMHLSTRYVRIDLSAE